MPRQTGRKEKYHGLRALLNRPGQQTTAAIVAEIEDSSTWAGLPYRYSNPDTCLQFANCDRSIAFEIDVTSNEARYRNDLHKIDLMIKALQGFRAGMVIEPFPPQAAYPGASRVA